MASLALLNDVGMTGIGYKQTLVEGIRFERRIEIDQVNALGRDVVAENLEVVAVVERLHAERIHSRGGL